MSAALVLAGVLAITIVTGLLVRSMLKPERDPFAARAQCRDCNWIGPWRTTRYEARADAIQHSKDTEPPP